VKKPRRNGLSSSGVSANLKDQLATITPSTSSTDRERMRWARWILKGEREGGREGGRES
jgi:hypothetical protein